MTNDKDNYDTSRHYKVIHELGGNHSIVRDELDGIDDKHKFHTFMIQNHNEDDIAIHADALAMALHAKHNKTTTKHR